MKGQTIVIWGAGRIGRGFVADLFHAAGYHLVFVDQSKELTERLRQEGRYTVVYAESAERQRKVVISGYEALATVQAGESTAAVAAADLLALAVYPRAFEQVARQLVPGLLARRTDRPDTPLDILLCTNLVHAGPQFRAALQEALPLKAQSYAETQVGIVETLVIRISPDPPADLRVRDPLLVWTNGYPELPVDRHGFAGPIPPVPGLRLVDDMRAEEVRKLYTYNTFHAALAYLGALRGHTLIAECMADLAVRVEAQGALDEASRALQAKHGFSAAEMARWTEGVVRYTDNPVLGDTVRRYGADPRRKLQREDRLVGPALLAYAHGIDPHHLIRAIAAALRFDEEGDPGAACVRQRVEALGVEEAVPELCGLTQAEQDMARAIVQAYRLYDLSVLGRKTP
jgi:mannitol-1-phosphate 5-dehydrogenase